MNASIKEKFNTANVQIGQSLDYDLQGANGQTFFKRGFVINTETSLQRLKSMELYIVNKEPNLSSSQSEQYEPAEQITSEIDVNTIFSQIDKLILATDNILKGIESGEVKTIRPIIQHINWVKIFFQNKPDACLATIHIYKNHACAKRHTLFSMFLALMASNGLGMNHTQQRSLVSAAMTANLGMLEDQDLLMEQSSPLINSQVERLHHHPLKSVAKLTRLGITEKLWLTIVEQHHERSDGTGYPRGLTREHIQREAILLGIIDSYLELILHKTYGENVHPSKALKIIYDSYKKDVEIVSLALIKQMGIYPPGSQVRLINDDIAVVTQRSPDNSLRPRVFAVTGKDGSTYAPPVLRNTSDSKYKIVSPCDKDIPASINLSAFWPGNSS